MASAPCPSVDILWPQHLDALAMLEAVHSFVVCGHLHSRVHVMLVSLERVRAKKVFWHIMCPMIYPQEKHKSKGIFWLVVNYRLAKRICILRNESPV